MEEKTYGYIRVSSKEQNEDRQRIAMQEFGVPDDCVFMDKQSGKDFDRPGYRRMLRKIKPSDILVIKSIDRLGRNYEEILEQWRVITKSLSVNKQLWYNSHQRRWKNGEKELQIMDNIRCVLGGRKG